MEMGAGPGQEGLGHVACLGDLPSLLLAPRACWI